MKKWFAFALVLVMLVSLAACGKEEPQTTTAAPKEFSPLQVGYARKVITPEEPMILDGYFDKTNRISTTVSDDIYAACTAFTDGEGNTILLYQMDLLVCSTWTVLCRQAVSQATNVPFENVMVACTHTHSGPDVRSGYETETRYTELLKARMTEAAKEALADRKPAEMYSASTTLTNMNFVRHYVMSDGSYVGDNFGSTTGKTIVRHESDADNEMQLLCFKREGGTDVVLVNWQGHPTRGGGQTKTNISSDLVGVMRDYVEAKLGCNFAYFTGASGNVNHTSRITAENITSSMKHQGEELGRHAVLALDNAKKLQTGKVQILKEDFENVDNVTNTIAFSIGDVAFALAPYEMFSVNGSYIKDNSPFTTTFVVTCANTHSNYMPSAAVYDYGVDAYELKGGYKKGTAENLATGYVGLLNKLYPTRYLDGEVKSANLPTAANDLFWNLDRGTERKAGSDGTYSVSFLKLGQTVTLKAADKAMMDKIDTMDVMTLQVDGDKITAVFPLSETKYHRVTQNYYIQEINSNLVKANSMETLKGQEASFVLNTATQCYDLSENATTPGETTQLQVTDVATVIANDEGKILFVFVTQRVARSEPDATPRYCEHCKKDVIWSKWLDTKTLPRDGGHYYLSDNVILTETMNLSGVDLCLDLNGKTVKQTSMGERIYSLGSTTTFNLMDTGETGTMIPASTNQELKYKFGMTVNLDGSNCVMNYYSGTIDASECTANYACGIAITSGTVNMYGGTIKGGTTYGSGSGCMTVGQNGTLVMYDGNLVGGNLINNGYSSGTSNGGAVMRVVGKATIYGGTFSGGSTIYNGGVLFVRNEGDLTMLGGTVYGGSCDGYAGGLYVEGKLTLGKGVTITDNQNGNVYLTATATFVIHQDGLEGTQIGIDAANTGVFAAGTFTAEDAAHFTSDHAEKTISVTDQGLVLDFITQ